MKKIILCIVLISVLFILTSCGGTDLSAKIQRHAMIIMPDGSLIQGICTELTRYSNNYMYVKVDDVKYYLDTWRIVTWEK